MIEKKPNLTKEQSDYIFANYKTQSMKEISNALNVPILSISKFFKTHNLESVFKCNNFGHNEYYGEISFTCFKMHVESALEYNLKDIKDVFNLAILSYCFETHHDINEAKQYFCEYFYSVLVPELNELKNKQIIIKPELIHFLVEKSKTKGSKT